MKALYILPMQDRPILHEDGGYNTVTGAYLDGWGLYEISATAVDLNLLAAMPDAVELLRRGVPLPGETPPPWDTLPVPGTARTRYNAWIATHYPELDPIQPGDRGDVFVLLAHAMGNEDFTYAGLFIKDRE